MNVIASVCVYLLVQMCIVWIIYRLLKNPSVVDASWSIGLMVSGLMYLGSGPLNVRSKIVATLIMLWALRLAGYLWYTRIYQGHIDKRYTELSSKWKINQSLGFFLNFQLQGLLIFILSFVFYWVSRANNPGLTLIDVVAIATVLAGIIGESLADFQLHQFKKQQKNEVCTIGLWNYSRHPNYFFDWVTWLGFAIFALQSKYGYLGIMSPFVLYLLFTQITGPMTERGSVESKGQKYLNYQNQTSMFFPWFKRKNDFV